MKRICFTIINAVAPLSALHQLSDAGAGMAAMHLTPTRDSEIIATGQALTSLPKILPLPKTAGLLGNGGISPAVLTHGLLKLLTSLGYQIEINSFNFGNPLPQQIASNTGWQVRHFGGEDANWQTLSHCLFETLQAQAQQGAQQVLAECGVGGTTYSTLWLRGLLQQPLMLAGSTVDPKKLFHKQQTLKDLKSKYLQQGFVLSTMLQETGGHDAIQYALCYVLRHWSSTKGLPFPLLAGGMMFVAPLLAIIQNQPLTFACQLATTHWLIKGDAQQVMQALPDFCQWFQHRTSFKQSKHVCLQVYEQGLVVEGCGLGGMLVTLEQLGVAEPQLIQALDATVTDYLHQARQQQLMQEAVA